MNNMQEIKESLAKSTQLAEIIEVLPPLPKNKRIKLPLIRDINMVEKLIDDKLKTKERATKETKLKEAKTKWNKEITALHTKAVALRKEMEAFEAQIKKESNGYLTIDLDNTYSSYWGKLPKTMSDATEDEMIEAVDDEETINSQIRKEIAEQMLDIKLGLKPISDVRALLDRIDQIK